MTDVDLLRRLMLMLEERQLSPRQPVVILLPDEAGALNCSPQEVADGLDRLLAIEYIDGPGLDEEGFFLFRKLTRRGIQFVQAARRPGDWEKLKKQYATQHTGV